MKHYATKLLALLMALGLILSGCSLEGGGDQQQAEAPSLGGDSTQQEPDSSTEEPVISNTEEDFYRVCTSFSAQEVESFARQVKKQFLQQDWSEVASEIAYPITIGGETFESSSAFLAADLDGLFPKAFYEALEDESCQEMFCNWQGVSMGGGSVWIGSVPEEDDTERLCIININAEE
jgi:hypothetical protein